MKKKIECLGFKKKEKALKKKTILFNLSKLNPFKRKSSNGFYF